MKTLLTVDWDFFVEERPEWEFGHQESLLFLKMLWETRINMMGHITTTGQEKGFWDRIGKSGEDYMTWVSDSHAYVWGLLKGVNHVVIVDAHHDCWNGDSLGIDKSVKQIYCHNWLREWILGGNGRKATWVRPEWSKDQFEVPKDLKGRIKVVGLDDDWGVNLFDRVHVCRSGCWTPPWLDQKFKDFVSNRWQPVHTLQDGDWNPMESRWTAEETERLLNQDKDTRAELKRINGMAIGSISSNAFLNGRVEQSVKA